MHCPKCGKRQWCGCDDCRNKRGSLGLLLTRLRYGGPTQSADVNGQLLVRCSGCYLTQTSDWWKNLYNDIVSFEKLMRGMRNE